MKKILIQSLLFCPLVTSSLNLTAAYNTTAMKEPMIMKDMPEMPNEPLMTSPHDKSTMNVGKTYKKKRKKNTTTRKPLGERINNLEARVTKLEEITGAMPSSM
jgi:hypothetical protein